MFVSEVCNVTRDLSATGMELHETALLSPMPLSWLRRHVGWRRLLIVTESR
jgi:hypothetical protein